MQKNYVSRIIYLVISVVLGVILALTFNGGFFVQKLIFSIVTCIAVFDSLSYAILGYGMLDRKAFEKCLPLRYIFALVGLLIVFYWPLCSEGFFFLDDYLNFTGIWGITAFFEYTATQGRQITGLLTDLMNYVTVQNSFHLRLFAVGGTIIYALVIAQLFFQLSIQPTKSIILALLLSILTPVINVVAYGSMFCYPLAFVFSSRAIIYFKYGLQTKEFYSKLFYFIFGGILIVLSNFVYQATATVAFTVILIIYLYNRQDNVKNFPLYSTTAFVLSTGAYYLLVKLLSAKQGADIMGRASIVSSLDEIIAKITWFKSVFVENLKQVISSFVGCNAFITPGMHYLLFFKNNIVKIISVGLLLFLLLIGLIRITKSKRLWGCIQVLALFPLSYYVFLILSESSYASCYSVALSSNILLIAIYALEGIAGLLLTKIRFTNNMIPLYLSVALVLMAFLNGNHYINHFWVDYNSYGYDTIKHTLQQDYVDQKRVHITGCLYPGQADVYAASAARIACKELGLPYNTIKFTSSSNDNLIEPLTLEVYQQMRSVLPDDDVQLLESFYTIDNNFSICILNYEVMTEEDYQELYRLFHETAVIPDSNTENTLVIDIQGIDTLFAA